VYMNHAHNDWAEWAADGGIPLAALLAVFATATALVTRRRLWLLGVPAVFAHALVDFPLQKAALACAVMFVSGLGMASVSAHRQSAPAVAERRNSGSQHP
jgi:hypothetical protein